MSDLGYEHDPKFARYIADRKDDQARQERAPNLGAYRRQEEYSYREKT